MEIYHKLPDVPKRIVDKHHRYIRKKYSRDNANLLIKYCNEQNFEEISNLISNGMDLNQVVYMESYPIRHLLLNLKIHVNVIDFLLKNGADPNLTFNDEQYSNLSTSIIRGNNQSTKLLLKYGANVNVKNPNGYPPLMTAILLKNKEIIRECIKYGADKSFSNGKNTPYTLASFFNENEIIDILKEN